MTELWWRNRRKDIWFKKRWGKEKLGRLRVVPEDNDGSQDGMNEGAQDGNEVENAKAFETQIRGGEGKEDEGETEDE